MNNQEQQPQISSPFINDIKEIDEKIQLNESNFNISEDPLVVAFMPYYVNPNDNVLTVVLKREVQFGAYLRSGKKMGLSTINVELPMENPITIEEAWNKLGLDVNIQNATPFGSVMTSPTTSTYGVEMVLVHVDPPKFLDEKRQIIKQVKGEYEIGSIPFDQMLGAIQDNFLQDMTTRLMLSELYIMAMEEANQQAQGMGSDQFSAATNDGNGLVGGGANHASEFYENVEDDNMPKTSNLDDGMLNQNKQKDFGAIYAQK